MSPRLFIQGLLMLNVPNVQIAQNSKLHFSVPLAKCALLFLNLIIWLSHLLTSGSECLGNSEVVRYLYRIRISSCSNPLLQTKQKRAKPLNLTTFTTHCAKS